MAVNAVFNIFVGLVASLLFQSLLSSQSTLHAVGNEGQHEVHEDIMTHRMTDSVIQETATHSRSVSGSPQDLACPAPCPACPACAGCPVCPGSPACPASPACPEPPACPRTIPPGYRYYEGLGYYKAHMEHQSWFDAKATCEREGAYLIVINSQKEADMARSLMKQYAHITYIHVGFHDFMYTKNQRNFITVLGGDLEETGYTLWAPKEPNGGGKEYCGNLHCFENGYNDGTCSTANPFVCELFE